MAALCERIFQDGWACSWDINKHPIAPPSTCAHKAREGIFHSVLKNSQQSFNFWVNSSRKIRYSSNPDQGVIDDMKVGPVRLQRFKFIAIALASIRIKCQTCRNGGASDDDGGVKLSEEESESSRGGTGDEKHTEPTNSGSAPSNLVPIKPLSKTPIPPIDLPDENDNNDGFQVSKNMGNCDNYDDYDSALAVSFQEDPDIIPDTWTFDCRGMLVLGRNWSLWRDRGHRLPPRFFSMFESQEPVCVYDHLLPYREARYYPPLCLGRHAYTKNHKLDKLEPINRQARSYSDGRTGYA